MDATDMVASSGSSPAHSWRSTPLRFLGRTPSRMIIVAVAVCVCQSVPALSRASEQTPGNAANDYRRAFEEITRLPEIDAALPALNEPLPPRDKSEQTVSRLGPAMKCLQEATAKKTWDWETDLHRKGAAATFPHVPKSQDLARRAVFRARCYWQWGKRDQAVEDVRAVVILARRVGDEARSGLLGLTERYKMEQGVVDILRRWMVDAESGRSLDGICQFALQPEGNLPKAGLLLERETILPWVRRLASAEDFTAEEQKWRQEYLGKSLAERGSPWILQKTDEAKVHYTEVGDLMDKPIGQFIPQFSDYIRRLDGSGNPFSQVAIVECPGIKRAYVQSRNLRAQWTILKVASSILQRGPGAVKETADPYGNGPLKYAALPDGFTLSSALVIDERPVTLSFAQVVRR